MNFVFQEFQKLLKDKSIQIVNKYLNDTLLNFSFYFINRDQQDNISILDNTAKFNIIVDDHINKISKFVFDQDFFIVCFDNNLVIIDRSEFNQFYQFLLKNKNSKLYLLSKTTEDEIYQLMKNYQSNIQFHFSQINEMNNLIQKSYEKMQNQFKIEIKNCVSGKSDKIKAFWSIIQPSILYFLLQKSFNNSKIDRIFHYGEFFKSKGEFNEMKIQNNEYIELYNIGNGSTSAVFIIYHIPSEKILIKKIFYKDETQKDLREIEKINYLNIKHPLFPLYYGSINDSYCYKCLILEYIDGTNLANINELKLSLNDKIKIVFQIMIVIEYLHYNDFIYRDLKPDNIMLDKNKTAYLLDLNKMIKNPKSIDEIMSFSVCSCFSAPEILAGKRYTNKVDIYSLGFTIEYIFSEEIKNNKINLNYIISKMKSEDPDKRPTISELIEIFYSDFFSKIAPASVLNTIKTTNNIHNEIFFPFWFLISEYDNSEAQYQLGQIYREGKLFQKDINKAIQFYTESVKSNHYKAQAKLGLIYSEERIDIQKAIYYLTLSINQNQNQKQKNNKAEFNIGKLFFEGKVSSYDINKVINYFSLTANRNKPFTQVFLGSIFISNRYCLYNLNKAIYYFNLAANQNDSLAQLNLGLIYISGKFGAFDINKAIYYLTLAANQNELIAQNHLYNIYLSNKYGKYDPNKAIHFLTLAANQNDSKAQVYLGNFYFEGKFVHRDINKALYYLTLAANKNDSKAQLFLGFIYYIGEVIQRDIDKSIYYLTLAAKQNELLAILNLGIIYYDGKFIQRNINKGVYYLNLAAQRNHPEAQENLGFYYFKGQFIQRDIDKAIYYFTLAANQNNVNSQLMLGIIYSNDFFGKKDIKKAIHYYTLAANQNNVRAQSELGNIYYNSKDINHDINKAIYYLKLASDSNNSVCQFNLGLIYYEGIHIPFDLNKAIHYFTMSANQNDSQAQTYLGYIYINGKGIQPDYKKALHYFNLAANQNNSDAQCNLGILYYNNEFIPRDISKSIYYFTLSANKSNRISQYYLGIIYYKYKNDIKKSIHYFKLSADQSFTNAEKFLGTLYYVLQDINKSIHYLTKAAIKNDFLSNYSLGIIYLEGQFISRDYDKAIHYFKNASSFNDQYSKNNLGVVLKKLKNDTGFAIELFEEAIRQKNDFLAMYNLAHIYFYDDLDIEKSINLLIISLRYNFNPSKTLLSLILIKRISKINLFSIEQELKKFGNNSFGLNQEILDIIVENNLENENIYKNFYYSFKDMYYVYNILYKIELFSDMTSKKKLLKKTIVKNINKNFYDGLNIE